MSHVYQDQTAASPPTPLRRQKSASLRLGIRRIFPSKQSPPRQEFDYIPSTVRPPPTSSPADLIPRVALVMRSADLFSTQPPNKPCVSQPYYELDAHDFHPLHLSPTVPLDALGVAMPPFSMAPMAPMTPFELAHMRAGRALSADSATDKAVTASRTNPPHHLRQLSIPTPDRRALSTTSPTKAYASRFYTSDDAPPPLTHSPAPSLTISPSPSSAAGSCHDSARSISQRQRDSTEMTRARRAEAFATPPLGPQQSVSARPSLDTPTRPQSLRRHRRCPTTASITVSPPIPDTPRAHQPATPSRTAPRAALEAQSFAVRLAQLESRMGAVEGRVAAVELAALISSAPPSPTGSADAATRRRNRRAAIIGSPTLRLDSLPAPAPTPPMSTHCFADSASKLPTLPPTPPSPSSATALASPFHSHNVSVSHGVAAEACPPCVADVTRAIADLRAEMAALAASVRAAQSPVLSPALARSPVVTRPRRVLVRETSSFSEDEAEEDEADDGAGEEDEVDEAWAVRMPASWRGAAMVRA